MPLITKEVQHGNVKSDTCTPKQRMHLRTSKSVRKHAKKTGSIMNGQGAGRDVQPSAEAMHAFESDTFETSASPSHGIPEMETDSDYVESFDQNGFAAHLPCETLPVDGPSRLCWPDVTYPNTIVEAWNEYQAAATSLISFGGACESFSDFVAVYPPGVLQRWVAHEHELMNALAELQSA